MLSLARLVGIAVVVELYVSVVGWYVHQGAEVCILASLLVVLRPGRVHKRPQRDAIGPGQRPWKIGWCFGWVLP